MDFLSEAKFKVCSRMWTNQLNFYRNFLVKNLITIYMSIWFLLHDLNVIVLSFSAEIITSKKCASREILQLT